MSAEDQLESFIAKFSSPNQALIRALRAGMRRRLPTATELVYDNYNFFVIGYGPNERPSDAFISIAAARSGVNLMFLKGVTLADPHKLLGGSGSLNRSLKVKQASEIDRPEVEALIAEAVAQSDVPLPAIGGGKLIIRSISEKQRARK